MLNWVIAVTSCTVLFSSQTLAQWGNAGHVNYPKFVPGALYPPEANVGKGDGIYLGGYKAPDYGHNYAPKYDNIFNRRSDHVDPHHHNKYNEKVLRKAYNDFIDNKIAMKKRLFTSLLQKTIDKTVDVTASLTKNAVDFISKISIDTAAHVAKNGAKAVIHKKEEKYNHHH